MSQPFSDVLRQRRKAAGLTQEQLAERVHVSRQTISNWENGRANPDYELLKSLSEALDTPLPELLGMEELPSEPAQAPEADVQTAAPAAPAAHSRLRTPLLCALTALLVLACVGLYHWRQSRPVPSPYPAAWFMQQQEAQDGRAHAQMSVLETPVRPQLVDADGTLRWRYQVYVREVGGVGFTIDRLICYYFLPDGGHTKTITTGSVMADGFHRNHVSAGAVRSYLFQDTSKSPFEGVGILLEGTDDNGQPVTARYYVPYAAEP